MGTASLDMTTNHSLMGRRVPDGSGELDDLEARRLEAATRTLVLGVHPEPVRLGRFTILERLGAGSMGEVYGAYDEELDRKVAIKAVRPDTRLATAGARIQREARTLARLSHPNVVQVYEVGRVEDRMFIAMEFVRGGDLRRWLAEKPRTWQDIVAVFVQAGRGLAAAHKAGLVHRDIKPGNVLVGDDRRVCVADFGLARPVHDAGVPGGAKFSASAEFSAPGGLSMPATHGGARENRDAHVQITESNALAGTPAYMAPEQWAGAAADHRSDQFSFCVALYEALYGVLPFAGRTARELAQAVTTGDPHPPPRTTLVPARFWSIVQRGMSRDPDKRFADMDTLVRVLTHDPRSTWRKWAVLPILLAGVIVTAVAFAGQREVVDPCELAGTELSAVWNPASKQRLGAVFAGLGGSHGRDTWLRVAERVDRYVAGWSATRVQACQATHVYHSQSPALLDMHSACLDRGARELGALLDVFSRPDDRVLKNAVEAVSGLPDPGICNDTASLQRGVPLPREPAVVAAVQDTREVLARARAEELAGKYRDGLALAERGLAMAEAIDDYAPVRAEALYQLGSVEGYDGQYEAAERHLLDAVDGAESSRQDQLVADIWLRLTRMAARDLEDPERGMRWSRRTRAALGRVDSRDSRSAILENALGRMAMLQSRYEDAEAHYREAVALLEVSGQGATDFLAAAQHGLANVLEARSRFADAVVAYEHSRDLMMQEFGPEHPDVARVHLDLGLLWLGQGQPDRARPGLERALQIWLRAHGPEHRDVGRVHLSLAQYFLSTGDYEKAREHGKTAHAIYQKVLPEAHPSRANSAQALGVIHYFRNDLESSVAAYQDALRTQKLFLPADHPGIATTLVYLGTTLNKLGRQQEALAMYTDAAERLRDTEHHHLRALVLTARGGLLRDLGRRAEARPALEQAVAIRRAHPGSPVDMADAEWALARVLATQPREKCSAWKLARGARDVYAAQTGSGGERLHEVDAWLRRNPDGCPRSRDGNPGQQAD